VSSRSAASSRVSAASTWASSEPVCELCGSASRTSSAGGSLPGTGPESRVIPTCAPLWPTPDASSPTTAAPSVRAKIERLRATGERYEKRADGGDYQERLIEAVIRTQMDPNYCPCRCHTSTSSAAGSPARTSASPAAGPDWPENARVFGGSSQGSLGNYDPATSSLRTSQLSLIEDSTSSLRILPRAGSMRNGTIFQRQPLAPLTGGTGSGSWPTPGSQDATRGPSAELGGFRPSGQPRQVNLVDAVRHRTWSTPTQSDGMGGPGNSGRDGGENLRTQVGGSLNPTWVEWLMGFPLGWTDCGPWGTLSSPRSQNGSEGRS